MSDSIPSKIETTEPPSHSNELVQPVISTESDLDTKASTSSDISTNQQQEEVKPVVEEAPTRAIVFGDEKVDSSHEHVSSGAGFPRAGTLTMRRELTIDQKESAAAVYSEGKGDKKDDGESKHVDIVSLLLVKLHILFFFPFNVVYYFFFPSQLTLILFLFFLFFLDRTTSYSRCISS